MIKRRVFCILLLVLCMHLVSNAHAQQVISSNTTSTVVATGGDITVNSGVSINTSATRVTGINVNGVSVGSITNAGTINTSTSGGTAIYFNSTASSATIVNNGSMSSKDGIQIYSPVSVTNNASMSASDRAITVWATGSGSSITINNGLTGNYAAISNRAAGSTIDTIYNASGSTISGIFGIENVGTINTVTNYGTIRASRNNAADKAIGGGTIGTLVNYGTISTASASATAISSTVSNLANAQGSTVLKIENQPTSYSVIINSPSSYGKLSINNVTGNMSSFGIYAGSTVNAGTYSAVLSGITSTNLTAAKTGTYGGAYSWSLINSSGSIWDLVVASLATNISGGGTVYQTSGLGSSVNRVFDGGTLQVSSAGSISGGFTVNANHGKIDQNGLTSTFSGNFSDESVGSNGKLTIINTGTAKQGSVTLAGTNNHTGGTEVQAGAILSISSASALGSGTLSLVGSSTVPATLNTTSSMTISNPITVTGDPVFSVAPGTTTTITSPITDGASAGDVVVSGGGTVELTATNTYTGPTSIESGSTLLLSGSSSIANSTSVENSGTFSITSKVGNLSLRGSYTQTSSGSLLMNFSPTNNQKLLMTGAANLAGGLTLSASAGTYSSGRYTLINANGITGRFSDFSSNLASYTRLSYALDYDANNVYLLFTPNTSDTQQSLVSASNSLQGIFTLQNSVLVNSFMYDCNLFDKNNLCISAGGRNTAVSANNGLNNGSGLLIGAYRLLNSLRLGAYIDQNLSINNAGNQINLTNNTPLVGVFAGWNERIDGLGAELKLSAAYGQKNVSVTRQIYGTSEPGSGSSQLTSQGFQLMGKYNFMLPQELIGSPYLGIRYSQNNMGGYVESSSSSVTSPLTYNPINTNATTALAGVGISYRGISQTNIFASAGVESDLNTANGSYAASGISGLSPINFNANVIKNRPMAMIGVAYDVEKNQRFGVTGIYRQEPYQALSTTTVMATYTVGL